jgi:alkylhydroperoxidase/carboxymuconolactone decarboxylase family protein YurZ
MTSQRDQLRRLSLHDPGYLEAMLSTASRDEGHLRLDARSRAVARLATLFALDGSVSTYGWATSAALGVGVTSDEIVELLVAMAPLIGTARVVSAAPKLGLALGYDVEADIEGLDRQLEATEAPVERIDAGIGQR